MARSRLIGLALVLLTLAVFLPVCWHGFILYDDPEYVLENRMVRAGLSLPGIKWAFLESHASNWHPLTWISHMVDCTIFGLDSGAHHMVNVLFHVANTALLFVLLRRLLGFLYESAFIAALFALHPLHVESVAWVAERKDVLSTFFWMLTVLSYVRYTQNSSSNAANPPTSNRRHWFYWASVGSYLLALLSKPMVVTLPFLLLLLDWWPLNRWQFDQKTSELKNLATPQPQPVSSSRLFLEKVPYLLLTIPACLVTFLAQRKDSVVSLSRLSIEGRIENALVGYVSYLFKTFWPTRLAIIYPLPEKHTWTVALAAAALLVLLTVIAWRLHRRKPWLLMGWLWFLGTLVPVIGLVQVGLQAIADRYTYVPLLGIFLAVTLECSDRLRHFKVNRSAVAWTGCAILGVLVLQTEHQLSFWKDSAALFRHTLAVTKNNPVAHTDLGIAYEQRGDLIAAEQEYREAIRLQPELAATHNNLANVLEKLGRSAEALAEYREAVKLSPGAFLAHLNSAALLVKMHDFEAAFREIEVAAQIDPTDPRPDFVAAKALLHLGRNAEAIARLQQALRLDPNDPQILTYFARVRAAHPDAQIRNGSEALQLAEKADVVTGGREPLVLDVLGMAYAELGRFKEAVEAANAAAQLTGGTGEDAKTFQAHLEMYQANRPYRENFQ